jgi:hypothetical protein
MVETAGDKGSYAVSVPIYQTTQNHVPGPRTFAILYSSAFEMFRIYNRPSPFWKFTIMKNPLNGKTAM